MKKYITLLLVMNGYLSKAQNNPIFNGGTADGWSRNGVAQAGNNIFNGGDGDGWHYNAVAQASNNIFKGGDGDGWSVSLYAQPSNNIYLGGSGDGWANNSFLQAGNNIFNGGDGDGWSMLSFLQAGNNIFTGGGGDGWASTYRPLGPLPITLLSFTAEKQSNTSLLKWQTAKEENTAYFDVERSSDAVHFQKIGSIAAAGNSTNTLSYSFVDAQPLGGYNYYRLRQVDKNAAFVYTPTRMLLFTTAGLQTVKAYPVPVLQWLTVELPASLQNEEVAVNLSNGLGVMVQQLKLSRNRIGNLGRLNLSALPAGVYTLQVVSASFNGSQVIVKQ